MKHTQPILYPHQENFTIFIKHFSQQVKEERVNVTADLGTAKPRLGNLQKVKSRGTDELVGQLWKQSDSLPTERESAGEANV